MTMAVRTFFIVATFMIFSCSAWITPSHLSIEKIIRVERNVMHYMISRDKFAETLFVTKNDNRASPPEHTHILVLPGFATQSNDYTKDNSLVPNLMRRGWNREQLHVLPMERLDWVKSILRGATDIDFLRAKSSPIGPAYCWYLQRVADEIRRINTETRQKYNCKAKIVLVGHSAGGWLARAAVGYGTEHFEDPNCDCKLKIDIDNILGIVTLGSPHLPSPVGEIDITGGALRATNNKFPGAYFADKLFYVTAAGSAVTGIRPKSWVMPKLDEVAYRSYKLVCGKGRCGGDGVVPIGAAHLDGALQLNIKNVFHAAELSSAWYGADNIIDYWLGAVTRSIEQAIL